MEGRPTMQQLNEVMRIEHIEITTKWYDLGLELVDSNTLAVIRADHRNDASACCHTMFGKWLEMRPDASWSHLITALNNIHLNTAADAISKQFKSDSEHTL